MSSDPNNLQYSARDYKRFHLRSEAVQQGFKNVSRDLSDKLASFVLDCTLHVCR
jgi:hypothetical protein